MEDVVEVAGEEMEAMETGLDIGEDIGVLKTKVEHLETTIQGLEEWKENFKTDLELLREEMHTFFSGYETLAGKINDLNERVETLVTIDRSDGDSTEPTVSTEGGAEGVEEQTIIEGEKPLKRKRKGLTFLW